MSAFSKRFEGHVRADLVTNLKQSALVFAGVLRLLCEQDIPLRQIEAQVQTFAPIV
jgi:hypothetical protein